MNRRNFALLWSIFLAILVSSCTNLDEIYRRLDDYESRLARVEKLTEGANRDIIALKGLIDAQKSNLTIASWRTLDDGSGYVLTMSDDSKITLKNGSDGISSAIGVRKGKDGIQYWTINGKYMYDADGNKIKAEGIDGASGVTPRLRVKDGYWEYSLDGMNWLPIRDDNNQRVKASGDGGSSDLKIDDSSKPGFLIITFKGKRYEIPLNGQGGSIVVPGEVTIKFAKSEMTVAPNTQGSIEYTLTPENTDTKIVWESSNENVVKILTHKGDFSALSEGESTITATIGASKATCKIIVKAGAYRKVNFEITINKNVPTEALLSLKSPDSEMTHVFLACKAETYDKYGKDRIFEEWDRANWIKLSPSDWKGYLNKFFLRKGNVTNDKLSETGARIEPGKEYVAYVYGCDKEGNRTTEVVEKRFTLEPMKVIAGLDFEIKIKEETEKGPIVEVIPTDQNRQYIIYICNYNYYDGWKKKADGGDKDALPYMGLEIARDGKIGATMLKTKGNAEFGPGVQYTPRDRQLRFWDQAIIVFGYDDEQGVNSEIKAVKISKRKKN